MTKKIFNGIRCPYCKGFLNVVYNLADTKIISCICADYPYIGGVFYLKKNILAERAIKLIKQGRFNNALLQLVNVRFLLSIPVRYLLLNINLMGLKYFLLFMQVFTFDESYSKYLIHRNNDASFRLSVFSTNFIKNNDKILDVGCGVGHLLPYISLKCKGRNIYGIDDSFLELLIARRFFADPKTVLICCDAEKGLPFKTGFLNTIIITDTFHYLKHKFSFLQETSRTLYGAGLLFIIQTINGSGIVYNDIRAIKPKSVLDMLNRVRFKKINIFPNSDIAYTVFASKEDNNKDVWI